ncbi:MAG: putative RDD family membrane protein YckC [Candidatus Poriferisodalaceae bacterium]
MDQNILVTPEGVVLDIETAGLASRVLARALDLVILFVALIVALVALAAFDVPSWLLIVVIVALVFLVVFVYPVVMETLWRGRTVGKAATGLRVLTVDGGPISLRHSAIRSMLGVVDLAATSGFAGVVSIVLSPRDQRLGDVAAGTIVVRDRGSFMKRPSVPALPPPGYEAFVANIDVATLTSAEFAAGREVLARLPELRFDRGRDLVRRYADHFDERLGSVRPERMDRHVFLAAVIAAEPAGGGPNDIDWSAPYEPSAPMGSLPALPALPDLPGLPGL